MSELGFAWFSEPKLAKGGWCLLRGQFINFQNVGELDNSVVWMTNVPNKEFAKQGLWHYQHLRDDQYIRVSVQQIVKELGVSIRDIHAVEQIMRLVVDVGNRLSEMFEISHKSVRYKLCQELRDIVVPKELDATPSGDDLHTLRKVFKESTQFNQGCKPLTGVTGLSLYNYVFPRTQFSTYLLNQNYPVSSQFELIELFDKPMVVGTKSGQSLVNTETVKQTLIKLHQDKALFLNVKVRSIEQKYERGFNFGSEGAFATPRSWAVLPEVVRMLDYCELELHKGYLTNAGQLPNRPPIEQPKINLSYARGIVAENILVAMAERQSGAGKEKFHTALGAYIRAYDRLMCSKVAEQFMMKGFHLAGFGMGYVRLWLNEQSREEADKLALQLGLLPKFGK